MRTKYLKTGMMSILVCVIVFSLIWWILTDGNIHSWWIGVPAVVLAVWVSIRLGLPVQMNGYAILKFIPFFFMRSLLGGIDVARRAYHPMLPIAPAFIEYPLRIPPGLPRVLMANIASLLPGTLSAGINQDILTVHVLDCRNDIYPELAEVEQHVARIFVMGLQASEGGQ